MRSFLDECYIMDNINININWIYTSEMDVKFIRELIRNNRNHTNEHIRKWLDRNEIKLNE